MTSFYDHFNENERAVLRKRAERVADKTAEAQEDLARIEIMVITLGSETYGLPLRALTAAYQVNVNLVTPVVPVPCTPPYIAGIANIRGHVVPVIDLAVLLGLPASAAAGPTGIVVVANAAATMAFGVDRIGDAARARLEELVPVSDLFDLAKTEYLQGTLPDGTIVLNIDAILTDSTLIVDETVR
jgi:purine-binding chemotaxis protein CheW